MFFLLASVYHAAKCAVKKHFGLWPYGIAVRQLAPHHMAPHRTTSILIGNLFIKGRVCEFKIVAFRFLVNCL
jgi:hypothetical protein